MAANKWMKELQKIDGVVLQRKNPHDTVIRTPSPSLNFIFGNGWGLPRGYGALLSGPPRGGKTVIFNAMVGQLHKDDPEAIAIKFDTEFRTRGQLNESLARIYGIDLDRYLEIETNDPVNIFDSIESGEIRKQLEKGAPIRLIGMDSVNGIMGRKMANAKTVDQQLIGDMATTLQDGFKRILEIQRKFGFAMVAIAQARAEMDPDKVKYEHRTWKPAVTWGVLHYLEYYIEVAPVRGKSGKTDLSGQELTNEELKDMNDNSEVLGHKIRAVMTNSSLGPKGRVAEFTLDYDRGIINTHEEIAVLAVNRGIVDMGGAWISYKDKKWQGVKNFALELKDNVPLQEELLKELMALDKNGLQEKAVEMTEEEFNKANLKD